jgi:hypothetical protein
MYALAEVRLSTLDLEKLLPGEKNEASTASYE